MEHIFIPNVSEDIKPKVGMSFYSLEEAYEYYVQYAKTCGFNVRKASTKYNNAKVAEEREVVLKKYFCSKQGRHISKEGEGKKVSQLGESSKVVTEKDYKEKRKRVVGLSRTGCMTKLKIRLEKEFKR